MLINIQTEQILEINNFRAKVASIDTEQPSKITTIEIEYLEGPFEGQKKILRVIN